MRETCGADTKRYLSVVVIVKIDFHSCHASRSQSALLHSRTDQEGIISSVGRSGNRAGSLSSIWIGHSGETMVPRAIQTAHAFRKSMKVGSAQAFCHFLAQYTFSGTIRKKTRCKRRCHGPLYIRLYLSISLALIRAYTHCGCGVTWAGWLCGERIGWCCDEGYTFASAYETALCAPFGFAMLRNMASLSTSGLNSDCVYVGCSTDDREVAKCERFRQDI